SVQRSRAEHPIVVGDRLDTDIEGANAVGCASLLVLTGVTSPAELLAAPEHLRPTYVAADLSGLLVPHDEPQVEDGAAVCGRWRASARPDELTLALVDAPGGGGSDDRADDELDALRALCAVAWARAGVAPTPVRPIGEPAAAALRHLGLSGAGRNS
ncbi:MAG: glycerol-phosphatase, partial [Pseudonocardiales bacterium]|nr:glycerol-phosphatase [Pseudonocardiales bacterium]